MATHNINHTLKTAVITGLLLLCSTCSFADTLYPSEVRVASGSISSQAIEVLSQLQQSGPAASNRDWDTYIEADPSNAKFDGQFIFYADPGIKLDQIASLRLATNTLAASPDQERWSFQLRDFQANTWVWLTNNKNSSAWVWYRNDVAITSNPQRFISNNGEIRLRYRSNLKRAQVSDIDYLRLDIETTDAPPSDLVDIHLQSSIDKVQPMTGIVLWADSHNNTELKKSDEFVQLEYAYVRPSDVVVGDNQYDWSTLEKLLNQVADHGKQAILRWYYVYPGNRTTAVPNYIKNLNDYQETIETSEGQATGFPDWSHPELQQAHLDFYSAFAARYDKDPRIAFLQVGFGLWGEYHIYEPGARLGENFPSKAFQKTFLQHMAATFKELQWSISIDAGDNSTSPIPGQGSLLGLNFGNFDDSFMHQHHDQYNEDMWQLLKYTERFKKAPHGGELSYYSNYDQRHALDVGGMYGRTYEELSSKFYISYMIGNDQPGYQSNARIKSAGLANGYKFTITEFKASASQSQVTVKNTGIAPIYYDAYITIDGLRAEVSLKGLLPNTSQTVVINTGGNQPTLTIECDHLVAGQTIDFAADL